MVCTLQSLKTAEEKGKLEASAHSMYSSYRESILEHLFAAAVMRHLWLDGFRRLELLKSQVDNSGYDLVLEENAVTRHIQLKASHHGAATPRVGINIALGEKPSGCVVWSFFDEATLDIGPFLWFGGAPGERLPDISELQVVRHTKANARGIKTERPNMRYIPRAKFERINTVEVLVLRLFGPRPAPPTRDDEQGPAIVSHAAVCLSGTNQEFQG